MKKIFKITSLVAIVGLVALNTYLAGDILTKGETSLSSIFSLKSAMAEPGDDSGNITCYGSTPENVTVHCSRTTSGTTSGTIEGEVHADLEASWGVVSGSAGGSAGGSSSTGDQTTVTGTWDATGINCVPRYSPDMCVSHYPC